MSTGPVVVGVDGSAVSQTALEWALAAAQRQDSAVRAVHVWRWNSPSLALLVPAAPAIVAAAAQQDVEQQVEKALAGGQLTDVHVERRTAEGDAAVELLSATRGASLLVLGRHGQGGLLRQVVEPGLGSVTSHCLSHADVPVVVVPPHAAAAGPRRILVGVDGSGSSTAALRWAADYGHATGVPVTAVLNWQMGSVPAPEPPQEWALPALSDWEDSARRLLGSTVARTVGPDAEVQQLLLHRPPAAGLLESVRTDDLLVLGDRGRGGFARLLLGSVSRQCAEHAPCPVVVLRQRAAREDPLDQG